MCSQWLTYTGRKEGEMDNIESRIVSSCHGIDMHKVAGIAKIARYGKGFEDIDWEISFIEEDEPQRGIKFERENVFSENDAFILKVYFWSTGWKIEQIRIFKGKNDRLTQSECDNYETNNRFLFTSKLTDALLNYMKHATQYR